MCRLVLFSGLIISVLDFAIRDGGFTLTATRLGVTLFVVGLSIYVLARFTLRGFFSETLTIKPGHKLITNGPYRFIRHPIYLSEIFYFLSIPIFFSSHFGFVIMLALIPMLLYRIRIEERLLISKFGEEYMEYTRRTKKLIPYFY